MIGTDNKTEWALGLYGIANHESHSDICGKFFEEMIGLCRSFGVEPNYLAAEGPGCTGKYVKFKGKTRKKLLETKFDGVTVLALAVSPADSDEPSYDRLMAGSLSVDPTGKLMLCVVINESFMSNAAEQMEDVIEAFLNLSDWSFGFAFSDLVSRQPDFHILGIDNGALDSDERAALTTWYQSNFDQRKSKIRSIYPIMIFNEEQLGLTVSSEVVLRDYLTQTFPDACRKVGELLLCNIPSDSIPDLRSRFKKSGILIA